MFIDDPKPDFKVYKFHYFIEDEDGGEYPVIIGIKEKNGVFTLASFGEIKGHENKSPKGFFTTTQYITSNEKKIIKHFKKFEYEPNV